MKVEYRNIWISGDSGMNNDIKMKRKRERKGCERKTKKWERSKRNWRS